jgi:hypothetical protein
MSSSFRICAPGAIGLKIEESGNVFAGGRSESLVDIGIGLP